jgi:hypothetical protein
MDDIRLYWKVGGIADVVLDATRAATPDFGPAIR